MNKSSFLWGLEEKKNKEEEEEQEGKKPLSNSWIQINISEIGEEFYTNSWIQINISQSRLHEIITEYASQILNAQRITSSNIYTTKNNIPEKEDDELQAFKPR